MHSGYDLWLLEPFMEEEEGCVCSGLGTAACPVHDLLEDEDRDTDEERLEAVNEWLFEIGADEEELSG